MIMMNRKLLYAIRIDRLSINHNNNQSSSLMVFLVSSFAPFSSPSSLFRPTLLYFPSHFPSSNPFVSPSPYTALNIPVLSPRRWSPAGLHCPICEMLIYSLIRTLTPCPQSRKTLNSSERRLAYIISKTKEIFVDVETWGTSVVRYRPLCIN